MGDVALKQGQFGLEGPYTSGAGPTGGQSVYNGGSPVPATRRVAVEKGLGVDFKYVWESPMEARGTYAGAYQHVLEEITASGKVPALIYCDDVVYYGRMALSGTPTVTTLPAAPLTAPNQLLATTATALTMPTLTTNPHSVSDGAGAKILAVQLSATTNTGAGATALTVTITGADVYGNTITDVMVFGTGVNTYSYTMNTTGTPNYSTTFYTANYYYSVSSITCSVATAGQSLTIGSLNAFLWTFKNDMSSSTLYSATMEYWDGSASWQVPGCVLEKLAFQMQIGKSLKLDASFLAQQKKQLSAYASVVGGTPGSINPAGQAGSYQAMGNLKDSIAAAMSAYKCSVYADPIGTAPGTTQIAARLVDYKLDVEVGAKLGKAADGTPYPSFVGRDFYKFKGEMTMLFNSNQVSADPTEVTQFLNGNSRTTRMVMPGPLLPCGAVTGSTGWPTQLTAGAYGLMIDLAGKYTEMTEKDVDGRAAFSYKIEGEVDLQNMGAICQITVVSRVSPNAM